MHRGKLLSVIVAASLLSGCSIEKLYQARQARKSSSFQQMDFHALMIRYMKKEKANSIEGIYSVSGSVSKKGKGFMSSTEKEKTIDRKDNYAQVAILLDPGDTGRDYVEVSLDKEYRPSYSIVGEFSKAAKGSILVYKHLDPKNKTSTFTFTTDDNGELLEGMRVESDGNTTITYKLTYIKISPK